MCWDQTHPKVAYEYSFTNILIIIVGLTVHQYIRKNSFGGVFGWRHLTYIGMLNSSTELRQLRRFLTPAEDRNGRGWRLFTPRDSPPAVKSKLPVPCWKKIVIYEGRESVNFIDISSMRDICVSVNIILHMMVGSNLGGHTIPSFSSSSRISLKSICSSFPWLKVGSYQRGKELR